MHRRTFLASFAGAAGLMYLPRTFANVIAGTDAPGGTGRAGESPDVSAAGDLRLPRWGPYSKHLAGTSHIPDLASGIRFDLCAFPTLYRRRQIVPVATSDTGFYAWSASPELESYTFRHALADLDTLYADIRYDLADGGRVLGAQFVNRTALPQQVGLELLAGIRFPESGPNRRPPVIPAEVKLPPGGEWIDGSAYAQLSLHDDDALRHLPDNAEIWGEIRADGFVHGTGLGRGFGAVATDRAVYAVRPGLETSGYVALCRFRLGPGRKTTLQVGGAFDGTVEAVGGPGFQLAQLPRGEAGARSFSVSTSGGTEIEIDGWALIPSGRAGELKFIPASLETRPRIDRVGENVLGLEYAAADGMYGLAWEGPGLVREWFTDDIARDFAFYAHEHVRRVIDSGGGLHYTNVSVRPIFLAPGETKTIHARVMHAPERESMAAELARWSGSVTRAAATSAAPLFERTSAGDAYAFGAERLAATLATNIVYPVRRRGRFIRHYTPGRWWDSLYTWDSGFIGLELAELSVQRSVDNLAAYLTDPQDDCAFIFHGSPVPTQIYQLQALWNRTQDLDLLRRFFPGARRMHRFLVGRGDGSRTANLRSGLLHTWDYFYNSGGWDDYPPQAFLRGKKDINRFAPAINSSHAIRTARLLSGMANQLGEPTDEFAEDIRRLTTALQTHAWNPETGWFSYVRHNAAGEAVGPLRHASGEDFNRGMDGISPLVAGICTPDQEALFLQRLRDPRVFWTQCGLSTVDQSAAYFRTDGYWNGAVWMPHQWFVWKALLDLGQGALAAEIALTALRTWEREVRATGCCFEHFITTTGRGAGWHQFGGLSAPVLSWFAALFRPGAITGGLDCFVTRRDYDGHVLRATLQLAGATDRRPVVLAVAPGREATDVRWRNERVAAIERVPGCIEITLPEGTGAGELVIA